MKRWLLLPLLLTATPALAGNWFGSGPWADGTYYPGQLDGRYFANVYNNLGGTFTRVTTTNTLLNTNSVTTTVISNGIPEIITTNIVTSTQVTNSTITGSVVSGVIGFAIRNGAPPFVNSSTVAVGAGGFGDGGGVSGTANSSSALQSLSLDRSLNNFLVYVNGDVYVGTTSANINPKSSTVSGVLANGAGRTRYQLFTNQAVAVASVAANVGVEVISIPSATASGYFNASVNNNKTPYTFSGGGTIAIATALGDVSEVDGTHNFNLNGIKTSGSSASAFPQTSAAVNPQQ
jgi:hypothetical protein